MDSLVRMHKSHFGEMPGASESDRDRRADVQVRLGLLTGFKLGPTALGLSLKNAHP